MLNVLPIPMSSSTARALSVVVAVGLPAGYLLQGLFPDARGPLWAAEMLLKLAGLVASVFLHLSGYGQHAQSRANRLDERQRAERDLAYAVSHQLMIGLLLAASFYGLIALPMGWWLPRADNAVDLLLAFAIGALALPAAILAWRDRLLPDED